MSAPNGIDPTVPPSGSGCVDCDAAGGWWVHLRRCAPCGHAGCCDSSPSQHASAHFAAGGHPVVQSFGPGEDWFWNYRDSEPVAGPELAPPARPGRPRSGRACPGGLAGPHPLITRAAPHGIRGGAARTG